MTHKDFDLISCYDAFTFTTLIQLEAYGFCVRGEGAEFVKGGGCHSITTAVQPKRRTSF